MGKKWKQWQTLFSWTPKSLWTVTAAMKWKDACSLEKSCDKLRRHIKNQRHFQTDIPVLWPPHAKSWLIGKDSDAGRDWGQEEKGMTEDEMAGWHHWLNGCESEWIPGVGDGQGGLEYCDSWGRKESDTTEKLNWTEEQVSWSGKFLCKHHHWLPLRYPERNPEAKCSLVPSKRPTSTPEVFIFLLIN